MEDTKDRLLSEKELLELISKRCGLGESVKFREIIRDCPTAKEKGE